MSDNVVKNSPIHQEALSRMGSDGKPLYDIDRISNGKLLAETAKDYAPISEAYPTHFGSHPKYDVQINNAITEVIDDAGININNLQGLSDTDLMNLIDEIELDAIDVLESWTSIKLN